MTLLLSFISSFDVVAAFLTAITDIDSPSSFVGSETVLFSNSSMVIVLSRSSDDLSSKVEPNRTDGGLNSLAIIPRPQTPPPLPPSVVGLNLEGNTLDKTPPPPPPIDDI